MSRTTTCVIVTCRGYERRTVETLAFTRPTKCYDHLTYITLLANMCDRDK